MNNLKKYHPHSLQGKELARFNMPGIIIRLCVIGVCIPGIVFLAVKSYRDENAFSILYETFSPAIDTTLSAVVLVQEGRKYLNSVIWTTNGNNTRNERVQNLLKAKEYFAAALKKNPDNYRAIGYNGVAHSMLAAQQSDVGDKINLVNKAMALLDRSIKCNKYDAEIRMWRGVLSVELPDNIFGKLNQGISDLEYSWNVKDTVETFDRNHYEICAFFLGKAYILINRLKEGERLLQIIIDSSSNSKLVAETKELIN